MRDRSASVELEMSRGWCETESTHAGDLYGRPVCIFVVPKEFLSLTASAHSHLSSIEAIVLPCCQLALHPHLRRSCPHCSFHPPTHRLHLLRRPRLWLRISVHTLGMLH